MRDSYLINQKEDEASPLGEKQNRKFLARISDMEDQI
jgi:hypothetical protein